MRSVNALGGFSFSVPAAPAMIDVTSRVPRNRAVLGAIAGRCGARHVTPQFVLTLARARRYEEMVPHHLWDCMLCGCCSYVCPSNIPLSQLFQLSKAALRKADAS